MQKIDGSCPNPRSIRTTHPENRRSLSESKIASDSTSEKSQKKNRQNPLPSIKIHLACGSVEGIFAVGDIAGYENKLYLITRGFFEGPTAVNTAKAYKEPDKKLKPIFSTTHSKLKHLRKSGIKH